MTGRFLLNVLALAAIAGCATPAPPPPPPDAAPASAAPAAPTPPPTGTGAGGFDGVYKSTSSTGMAKEGHNRCNNPISNLVVRNGNATMTWRGTMHGAVAADGSLDMKTAESHVSGQIASGVFTGKLETPVCLYTITLTKS